METHQIMLLQDLDRGNIEKYNKDFKVPRAGTLLAKCHYHSFLYTIVSNGYSFVIQKRLKNSVRPHSICWLSTFEQAYIRLLDIINGTDNFTRIMKERYNPNSSEAIERFGIELRYLS